MVKQYNSNQERVTKVKFVSDNMELVKRGREHQSYVESYVNATLRAEYDLTEQTYKYLMVMYHRTAVAYNLVVVV